MSSSQIIKDIQTVLPYIPSNRGYIVNGKKYYGKGPLANEGSDVQMISPDDCVHVWLRRGYLKQTNTTGTEWDVLTKNNTHTLVTSRAMRPCPAELENDGLCQQRLEPEHRKFFYHFAKYNNGQPVSHPTEYRVQCSYSYYGKWHCWEKNNGEHARVFYHPDGPTPLSSKRSSFQE